MAAPTKRYGTPPPNRRTVVMIKELEGQKVTASRSYTLYREFDEVVTTVEEGLDAAFEETEEPEEETPKKVIRKRRKV